MEDSSKLEGNFEWKVGFFSSLPFYVQRKNGQSEREEEKVPHILFPEQRGRYRCLSSVFAIFSHVFGVAPRLFFPLECMKMCNV